MKKLFAFFVILVIIVSYSIPVFATDISDNPIKGETLSAENEDNKQYELLPENAVILDYSFSNDFKKIDIRGNISYNTLITYGKYRLEVIRIGYNEDVEDVLLSGNIDVVAEMDISAKIDFSIRTQSTTELFSKYAVILRAENQPTVIASSPRYVNISLTEDTDPSKRENYKGISLSDTSDISISGDLGFGSVIIPIFYDRLISDSSKGYMYPFEDTYCYFDSSYINELDTKIKTHSMTGAKVYLQLLLPSNAEEYGADGMYLMPDIYDKDTIARISTYVRFLAGRYDSFTQGKIGGFIVGKKIDKFYYNYNGGLNDSEYAKRYALYLGIVANSARIENNTLDIIIPFSDSNSYSLEISNASGGYSSSKLLKDIITELDENYDPHFDYNILIESNKMPITNGLNGNNEMIFIPFENQDSIGIDNIVLVENYIRDLQRRYQSIPSDILYLWQIPSNILGNTLKCAYAYSYYSLLTHPEISSFIVDFSANEATAFEECNSVIKNIDIESGFTESNKLLRLFSVNNWSDLISDFSNSQTILRTAINSGKISPEHHSFIGSFKYSDFSMGYIGGWNNGANGKDIKSDYGIDGRRALHQTVNKTYGTAHSDMFCLYEYDENFAFTPILRFDIGITDSANSKGELYEIIITVGKDNHKVSESYIVKSGEISQLWFYVGEFSEQNKAGYIKLSTRSITGASDEYSVWLYDVIGLSEKYNNDELDARITSERSQIRNQTNLQESGKNENVVYWIVFAIIIIAITLIGVMFTVMRRDDILVRKNSDK